MSKVDQEWMIVDTRIEENNVPFKVWAKNIKGPYLNAAILPGSWYRFRVRRLHLVHNWGEWSEESANILTPGIEGKGLGQ